MSKTELTVAQLVRGGEDGRFALPFFQRDYVWDKNDIAMFLDSMSKAWPAGSIILWDKPRVRGRKFGSFKGNPKEVTTDRLVLDGQQRITTLLLLRQNGRITLEGEYGKSITYHFGFDLERGKFVASRNEISGDPQYVDTEDILRGRVKSRKIPKVYRRKQKHIIHNLQAMAEYRFPVIHTQVHSNEDAIDIFNRVNTTGKRVDKLELAFARLRDKEHGVSRRIAIFQSDWVKEGYDLTPRVLINSFLIVHNINDKEYYLRTRNADTQIRDYLDDSPRILSDWENVFRRIKNAIVFLKNAGFDSDQFLPSENAIAALSGFFERHDMKSHELTARRRNSLRKWLFRTLLFGRYTYTTNFEQDLQVLQDYGRLPDSKGVPPYSQDGLIALMYAIGRANKMTDYRGTEITWADTNRAGRVIHIDHIYPYSRLTKEPISDMATDSDSELADDIGNKAFAIGESNTSKNKEFPGKDWRTTGQWMDGFSLLCEQDYRKMCESRNSRALKHGWDDIKGFINQRHKRILRSINQQIR
jgi:hypothetical protein